MSTCRMLFFFLFLLYLRAVEFEFRVLHLLGRHFTIWDIPLALVIFLSFCPGLGSHPDPSFLHGGFPGMHHHTWLIDWDGFSPPLFPGLASNLHVPICASWVAGIIDVSHHMMLFFFLRLYCFYFFPWLLYLKQMAYRIIFHKFIFSWKNKEGMNKHSNTTKDFFKAY
jgi:hypothetical protein